ncbi:response regulator transcription factor [Fodinicurvata sediminis]|uniref:response regulator transcription factor n=1 Tax=Fodinicurvata sediminis TaxID=1121832 RepID=UPI0003B5DC47|nr:response regulator [Fodinicurvata sediminis]
MNPSILLVDDEPNIVLSLEVLLRGAGYHVRVAPDGEAALQACQDHRPDLIILDVMLPRRDGYDVCRLLREKAAWRAVPIIMLTARGRDEEREKGLAMGADAYITKPFSNRLILEQVETLLDSATV